MAVREILFKGKRVDNGDWVYGYFVPTTTNVYTKGIEVISQRGLIYDELDYYYPLFNSDEVIPETVCQYTGLTDKNGNKIFEGDIIYKPKKYKIDKDETYQIVFEYGCFQIKVDNGLGRYSFALDDTQFGLCTTEFEVIGNVFDNPELLRKDGIE